MTDNGKKLKETTAEQILKIWIKQQEEEGKLRKLYSCGLIIIFIAQLLVMYYIFYQVAAGVFTLSDTVLSVFFVSVFAEIVALVHTVTKSLYLKERLIDISPLMDGEPAKPAKKDGPGVTLSSDTKMAPDTRAPSGEESELETTPRGITYRIKY